MRTVCDCFASVLAPVSNDCDIIEDFVAEVMAVLQENYANYELVLVDDGSNDDTVSKVTELLKRYQCIRLIRLSRKFGEEIALSAALDSAIGDFVVLMRPNWDPPQLIPEIVQKAREGTGILFGVRNNREGDGSIIRAGAWLFYLYCEKVLKINLPRNSTQFRVLSRQAVNAIMQIKVRHRYLRTLIAHIGFNTGNFVYQPINRSGRAQTRSLLKAVNLGINIIVNASRHPLRVISWCGVVAGVVNLLYTGFALYSYLLGEDVASGWTSLSLQNAAMFFFVFLILTVLSEYIGQILIESEDRPLYYVYEERNSSVLIADQERKNVARNSIEDEFIQPAPTKMAG
jgi:polyisoprenyl-phosphate glycosyltransferase